MVFVLLRAKIFIVVMFRTLSWWRRWLPSFVLTYRIQLALVLLYSSALGQVKQLIPITSLLVRVSASVWSALNWKALVKSITFFISFRFRQLVSVNFVLSSIRNLCLIGHRHHAATEKLRYLTTVRKRLYLLLFSRWFLKCYWRQVSAFQRPQ